MLGMRMGITIITLTLQVILTLTMGMLMRYSNLKLGQKRGYLQYLNHQLRAYHQLLILSFSIEVKELIDKTQMSINLQC